MVMSPYEWKIVEWDDKKPKQTNKQRNKHHLEEIRHSKCNVFHIWKVLQGKDKTEFFCIVSRPTKRKIGRELGISSKWKIYTALNSW